MMSCYRRRLSPLSVLAAVLLLGCGSEFSFEIGGPENTIVGSLESGDFVRTYQLHLPPDTAGRDLPLLIVLHDIDISATEMRFATGLDMAADSMGLAVVYPDAFGDWAEGCGCSLAEQRGVDDVQFISDLIDELDTRLNIDRGRVFITGLSEGAFMTQKLACDITDQLAGVATVAATMTVAVAEVCAPAGEIPVLMIHGTNDPLVPWDGALDRGSTSTVAADTAAQFWATANGCGGGRSTVLEATDETFGIEVWRETFEDCPVNGEVILFRVEGGGHVWPNGSFSATQAIAEFFASR
jgi:polyhydroxybutyrate depolymerase